jgi:hypothetical protein
MVDRVQYDATKYMGIMFFRTLFFVILHLHRHSFFLYSLINWMKIHHDDIRLSFTRSDTSAENLKERAPLENMSIWRYFP